MDSSAAQDSEAPVPDHASPRDRKTAKPDHGILGLFARRWSPRAFADRPVEPEKIRRMLEAARWTMSSYNEQPWRYVVASRHERPEEYERLLGCLAEGNQSWARNAPVLMMAFYKKTFSRNDRANRCAPHDVGAASAALTFQATAMDLYVHQMAGIRKEEARKTYKVPDGFEPMTGLAVGYLGPPSMLSEKMQSAERSPRSRKPLDAFVFGGEWGESSDIVSGGE
jgi:nitroreductase